MIVSLLAAVDEWLGIGINNQLPWRLSGDLRRFKELTMGHHLIMGRRTFESIGQPLVGRIFIIVSRNPVYVIENCLTANSVPEAISMAEARGEDEVFVIGGGQIFEDALPLADRFYLTRVHARGNVDTFFPHFDPANWIEVHSEYQPADERNEHSFTFYILNKKQVEIPS
jgi:dihydrofolate reductase